MFAQHIAVRTELISEMLPLIKQIVLLKMSALRQSTQFRGRGVDGGGASVHRNGRLIAKVCHSSGRWLELLAVTKPLEARESLEEFPFEFLLKVWTLFSTFFSLKGTLLHYRCHR